MLPGRLHEGRGNAAPRGMAALDRIRLTGRLLYPWGSMSTKRFILIGTIIALGVSLSVFAALARRPADARQAVRVEGPMPVIDRPAMRGGGRVTPSAYRGSVVLVNFWASWCGPCRREQPFLNRLAEEYEDEVVFLGVNFDDGEAAALEYLREFDVAYPSVFDPDGKITADFVVPYLPATVLAGADGQLRYRLAGAQTEDTIRGYLEELLAED